MDINLNLLKKTIVWLGLLLILLGCVLPKRVIETQVMFENDNYRHKTYKYDFYIHDNLGATYSVKSPAINDSVIIGELIQVHKLEVPEDLFPFNDYKHFKEVHVYLKDTIRDYSNETLMTIDSGRISSISIYKRPVPNRITKNSIDNTEQNNEVDSTGVVFAGIFIGIILAILAFVGAIYLTIRSFFNSLSGPGYCYIATMVYGSYEADEVLILRKFRDERLKPYFLGRMFIAYYYLTSPYFVRIFKNVKWMNRLIKYVLDLCVRRLIRKNQWVLGTD